MRSRRACRDSQVESQGNRGTDPAEPPAFGWHDQRHHSRQTVLGSRVAIIIAEVPDEDAYYRRWEAEAHREHREFRQRSPEEQKEYRDWRFISPWLLAVHWRDHYLQIAARLRWRRTASEAPTRQETVRST